MIERRAELTGDVERMRLKALSDGSGVAGYRAQLGTFTEALMPKAPKPANRDMKPLFVSPEAWKTGLGAGNAAGRGNPQANNDLARRVDTGLVMPEPEFSKNFTAWIERGEMSDAMKLMIKRSGYGAKPSEFWRKQWRNQYGDAYPMPAQYQQVMPMRDQMKVSYQPTTGTTQPTAQLASNLSSFWQGLAANAANALTMTAPAAAGEMPMGTMGQSQIRSGNSQRQAVIDTANRLGIRPVDLAAVMSLETGGTYARDIKGGAGGNYQGLIQFGPNERKTYGYRPGMTFEEQLAGPVTKYLKARGVRPGAGVQEIYAAILTGNVANIARGGLDWKDSNGTSVRGALPSLTKGGHYRNAVRFLQGT